MDREHRIRLRCLIGALALAGGSCLALAQNPPDHPDTQTGTATGNATATASGNTATSINHTDSAFLQQAAQRNLTEVQTGQLAEQQALNPQVQRYGERMVQQGSEANDKLKTVAESAGVQLPTEPSQAQMQEMSKLKSKSGQQFDDAYARSELKVHHRNLKDYQHVAKTAQNPEVRAYAEQMLPVLKDRLAQVERLPANSGASGTSYQ
jgi:putative membrane protein